MKYITDASDWTAEELKMRRVDTFLTLDRARRELRVPPGDTFQDDLIRENVRSAASYIARDLSLPVGHVGVQVVVEPGENDALIVRDRYALEVTAIRHRGERDAPGVYSQAVDAAAWSQANPGNDGGAVGILSAVPNDAWPSSPDGLFAVTYIRGLLAMDPDLDNIRALGILKLRDLFFGVPVMKGAESNSAYGRLAAAVRRFDTPPFEVVGAA